MASWISIIAVLIILNVNIVYCQSIEYKNFNFEKGTENLDSNWLPICGNWIGSEISCNSSVHSLSTGEVDCGEHNATISFSNAHGPGYLSFSWQISGANTIMEVCLDNNKPNATCKSYTWTSANIYIPPGIHTIYWNLRFIKDDNDKCIFGSKGTGWLCNLRIPVSLPNGSIIDNIATNNITTNNITSDNISMVAITTYEYISRCDRLINDSYNLSAFAGASIGQVLCLSDGDLSGMINISHARDLIITSRIRNEAQLVGNHEGCNLVLYQCNNVTIDGLRLIDGIHGIWLQNSSNCKIVNNIICVDDGLGILLNGTSSNNIISSNDIYSSSYEGQPAIVIDGSNGNALACNHNYKKRGYSYSLISGKNNIISNANGIIYDEGREYEIKKNATEIACFFRIYPPILGTKALNKEIGPQFTDVESNTWFCGGPQC